MGNQDNLFHVEKCLCYERLMLEDIQSCTRNLPCKKRLYQRLFINNRATCSIYQNRSWFHLGQSLCINQMMGLRCVRDMQADKIRALEQFRKIGVCEIVGTLIFK